MEPLQFHTVSAVFQEKGREIKVFAASARALLPFCFVSWQRKNKPAFRSSLYSVKLWHLCQDMQS